MNRKRCQQIFSLFGIVLSLFFLSKNTLAASNVTINATVPERCGNSVVEGNEQCDDGNQDNNDLCTNLCRLVGGGGGPAPVIPPVVPPVNPPPEEQQPPEEQNPEEQPPAEEKPPEQKPQENPQPPQEKPDQNQPQLPPEGPAEPVVINEQVIEGVNGIVDGSQRVERTALLFWIADGTIPTSLQGGNLLTLNNDGVRIKLSKSRLLSQEVSSVILFIGGNESSFEYGNDNFYTTYFTVPPTGRYDAMVRVLYKNGLADFITFGIISAPSAQIYDAENKQSIPNAQVTLINTVTQKKSLFEAREGNFGFVVPNGSYVLEIKKTGYRTYRTQTFQVKNNIINTSVPLNKEKVPVLEQIKEKPLETVKKIFQDLGNTLQEVNKIADNPRVEQITEQVVAPVITSVAVAAVIPSIWNLLLPLLRFVFLQPFLLFGKKKREGWGVVYNSFTKLPVDLALVRLLDKNKKVKQSRVTDTKGRYIFVVEPGEYHIEVTKNGFVFPSVLLKDVKTDGKMVDIYHGELINVTDSSVTITPNIPLDPAGENKTPSRIIWEKRWRVLQHGISLSGLILAAISVYIAPVWYMWLILGAHVSLYLVFNYFIKPKKPQGWGIVYDKTTHKPIANAVVRLFTQEYNKLVSTQVTDSKGRYTFLVGPSNYYLTSEKQGYKLHKSDSIPVKSEKEPGLIQSNIGLETANNNQNTDKAGQT